MNGDYERYDFWFRETKQVEKKISMEKLTESNDKITKDDIDHLSDMKNSDEK